MRHRLLASVFSVLATVSATVSAAAPATAAPDVVASIHPIHSLVASVMQGVGEPKRLLPPGASPHSYALKPSEARMLSQADVVFQVGPDLETFLAQPLKSLGKDARVVSLAHAPDTLRLPVRSGGAWEHEDEHGHGHDHGHGHEAEEGVIDTHLWLDPRNASAWTAAIADALAEADPANAEAYRRNAQATQARLDDLEKTLEARLAPVKGVPYLVFHDAYQYLEHRFGLNAVGAVTVSPDQAPGARRVAELRDLVRDAGAACVFAEPQFEPRLVRVVVEDTKARPGVLDPLGAEHPPGPELYFTLMTDLADDLAGCLKGE